jgi:hypothetical protein
LNIEELITRGDGLFSKRSGLMSLWQEQADNFYVERSDFTVTRNLGTDFAAHLTSSYPLLVRRDLGDQISSILRPPGEQWFDVTIEREEKLGNADKRWLERATKTQYRAMYDLHSGFVRSTKECDHDWATFGNGVISAEINWEEMTLLHRCWHLRDVAWVEDYAGRVCEVHRKWAMTPYDMIRKFKGKVHSKIVERAQKEPFCEITCRHVVMEAKHYYDGKRVKAKYVSLVIDVENKMILEEVQRPHLGYVVPRWKTISGSQYAFSPATVIALPDARLIQSMALSLLEAGEMSVRPPLITVPDAIREDVQYFAGGITRADIEGDQQLKNVLAPILQDRSGFNFGLDLMKDTRDMIASAFYINKLMLPPAEKVMTAYETSQRVREYIRQSSPLFEPLLSNYNGELCEMDFELLMSVGAFGPREEFPQNLRGQNVRFKFKNPLQEAADQKKGQTLQMAIELTAQTMQLDPNAGAILNAPTALRDALSGIGTEADWMYDEDVSAKLIAQRQQQQQQAQAIQMAQQAGQAGQDLGKAGKELGAVA